MIPPGSGAGVPGDPADGPDEAGTPLGILGASIGAFPEISRLNTDFVPGRPRLKLTLKIDPRGLPPPAGMIESLEGVFPSLARHRCCGGGTLRGALSGEAAPGGGAAADGDRGVGVAHVVEHLIIDIQHFIGRMTICSGVTCAYKDPPDHYDLFVEAPEEKIGWLAASVAVGLTGDLLSGRPLDSHFRCVVEMARRARDRAGEPVHALVASTESAWSSEAISEAIDYLRLQGYLTARRASPSGETDYVYEP